MLKLLDLLFLSSNRPLEVAVAGKKQGVTKKKINTPAGRLQITKIELFRKFIETVEGNKDRMKLVPDDVDIRALTYREAKALSTKYQETWTFLKENYFKNWTRKPEFVDSFKLS